MDSTEYKQFSIVYHRVRAQYFSSCLYFLPTDYPFVSYTVQFRRVKYECLRELSKLYYIYAY